MEDIAKQTYEGKLKPGELSESYILETYNQLNQGIKKPNSEGMPTPLQLKMQQNVFRFSGAKNYAMHEELNKSLRQGMTWQEFKDKSLQLNNKYNVNYLQAEYQTAVTASERGLDWEAYVSNKDKYPNLEYQTQKDSKVRREHERLHGIIAPIDSDFWNKYYPPNGWRCRCYVRQTTAPADNNIPTITPKDVKPEFEVNVGKSGQIFKHSGGKIHPYFTLANTSENKLKFELYKEFAPNNIHTRPNGTIIEVNPFTDLRDFYGNLKCAILAADKLKMELKLPAHVFIDKVKNPEYRYKEIKGDRVQPKKDGKIGNQTNKLFRRKLSKRLNGQLANEKNCFLAAEIWFEENSKNLALFADVVKWGMDRYNNLDFMLIYNNTNMIRIDRNQINSIHNLLFDAFYKKSTT